MASPARKVLLLGAGASAATLGCDRAPISAGFGCALNAQSSGWQNRYPFLYQAVAYLHAQSGIDANNWPLDRVWNGIDENYKLRGIIQNPAFQWPRIVPHKRLYQQHQYPSWASFWILAGWELKRALADIYGAGLQPLLNADNLHNTFLALQTQALDPDDVLASTNYDLLLESLVRLRWPNSSNCRSEQEFRLRADNQGPLILKLHGSLDWLFRSNWITHQNRVDRTAGGAPIADNNIDLDENFLETRPLVVAPVRYKDEIVFPHSQPAELVEVLSFQWARFINALSTADELHVFGYRFPPEDSYGSRMLQEAMRRRGAGRQLIVRLWLPDDECHEVQARLLQDIFRASAAHVQCEGRIPCGVA